LLKLGGWENGCLTEDIEFSLRLLKKGYKIRYLDDLECSGEVPYKPKDLYKQQMRWAYGVIGSFKKHGYGIIRDQKLTLQDKMYICFVCSGYFFAILLFFLFLTGFLSFITHAPAPIDLPKFFMEMGRNILLTSGLIISSSYALIKIKYIKGIFKMLISSFTYGLIVTYYVNIGIIKVLTNRPMEWYLLNKEGNEMTA
jgi:cellulose synthase/poly-beta-1,6-N-acetylglucosamine synthase-like glycosyltransferase